MSSLSTCFLVGAEHSYLGCWSAQANVVCSSVDIDSLLLSLAAPVTKKGFSLVASKTELASGAQEAVQQKPD